ncbi:glycosyltransferase family 2 protein [Pseudoalteromonas sp. SCSIO 43201]|uniref:glycosyltransferase family 2 protein n=1 Tax=Pseudoalteromonas sp. SCSIO 43201 TaxID=2822842 RepID=UPI0020755E1F|nr:glycosyltransferase family 2 protein [Pseudoalteromonas sp. SCSIO 43201]USD29084.1 glycosyltransferase family 2 protein [Pseudoalteromonas sp. SCSIO 43201]
MAEPLVSVVMPAYNSEKYIAKSIESVIAQTYQNWELLITDDRSSDSTQKIAEQYCATDKRIKLFVNKENAGAGVARNNSIMHAKGRYIAFLDSDDLWLTTKLEKQIAFMLEHNYALTYTSYQKFTGDCYLGVVTPPLSTSYSKLLSSNVIGCLTAIYDTEIVGKQFMPLIRKRQDMGLWLKVLKITPKAYCLQETLAYYRIDSGMTQNKFLVLKWQWRFYREVVKLNFLNACYHFSIYSIKGFIKHSV